MCFNSGFSWTPSIPFLDSPQQLFCWLFQGSISVAILLCLRVRFSLRYLFVMSYRITQTFLCALVKLVFHDGSFSLSPYLYIIVIYVFFLFVFVFLKIMRQQDSNFTYILQDNIYYFLSRWYLHKTHTTACLIFIFFRWAWRHANNTLFLVCSFVLFHERRQYFWQFSNVREQFAFSFVCHVLCCCKRAITIFACFHFAVMISEIIIFWRNK